MQVYCNSRESEVLVELRDYLSRHPEQLNAGAEELAEALRLDEFAVEAALEALTLDDGVVAA
jgi:hypothetical protein